MRRSGEQDIVAEWQRLMRLWDSAYAEYSTVRDDLAESLHLGPADEKADAAIEPALRGLNGIKQQIDSLISGCQHSRTSSPDSLRFALLEVQATLLTDALPAGNSACFDQAAARSNKR